MDKKNANTDTTYCKGENCSNKCWRHIWNYKFDNDKAYWFMEYCEEEMKKIENWRKINE